MRIVILPFPYCRALFILPVIGCSGATETAMAVFRGVRSGPGFSRKESGCTEALKSRDALLDARLKHVCTVVAAACEDDAIVVDIRRRPRQIESRTRAAAHHKIIEVYHPNTGTVQKGVIGRVPSRGGSTCHLAVNVDSACETI